MNINPAPIKEAIIDKNGLNVVWIEWFNAVSRMLGKKRNQQGIAWTPVFSGLTFSTSGTITGTWTQRDNVVFFNVTITPVSGTTSSTLDTTKITNLPWISSGNWNGQAIQNTGKVDLGACFIKDGTTEIYTPSWTTISGIINLSGIYITNE